MDHLTRGSETKSEEIRTLIDKMDAYKKHKDAEVLKIRKKLQQAEEDIKVLVLEQERQKRVAAEKVKLL